MRRDSSQAGVCIFIPCDGHLELLFFDISRSASANDKWQGENMTSSNQFKSFGQLLQPVSQRICLAILVLCTPSLEFCGHFAS